MPMTQTRRRFLTTLSVASAAWFVGAPPLRAAEEQPEVSSVRIVKIPGDCLAPQYIAEELLHAEGFTDVRYVNTPIDVTIERLAHGEAEFSLEFAWNIIPAIDRGLAVTALSGVHVGCIELLANEQVHSIGDLKGKRVGIPGFGGSSHALLTLIAAQVGLDPRKDIRWVIDPLVSHKQLFIDGKIDAFLGISPDPQELRARQIGRTLLRTAEDRP